MKFYVFFFFGIKWVIDVRKYSHFTFKYLWANEIIIGFFL